LLTYANTEGIDMAKKTTCPISRAEFRAKAKPVTVTIGNVGQMAEVKEFSTGSLGWYLNGRTTIEIEGQHVPVLINASLVLVGSKELPMDVPAGAVASAEEDVA
jgi:hypothetical protein